MAEYVGFDVSKEETAFCVKDAEGEILARGKVATDPEALFAALKEHCLCPERIVLETGTLSGWVKRQFERLDKTVTARAEADPACRLLMSARDPAADVFRFRRHHRRCREVRQIAHGGRLCRADAAALAVGRDGLLGALLQARRRRAAQPAL